MDFLPKLVGIIMVFAISIVEVEGAAYDEDCSGQGVTCADANNICDTSDTNLCKCSTGYYRKTNAAECSEQVGLDGTCDSTDGATDQCSVADTECRDDGTGSKCLCVNTHFSDGTACQTKIAGLETACDDAVVDKNQCGFADTECRNDGTESKCFCKATHYSDGTVCQTRIAYGDACTGTGVGNCKETNNIVCDTNCKCSPGFFRKTTAAECAAQVGLDGTCDSTDSATDQCSVADTECRDDGTGSKCLCVNTHFSDGTACQTKIAGLETACDDAVVDKNQCGFADTECKNDGTESKCFCKATHYSDGTVCQTRKYPDATCVGDECVAHASCISTTCVCDAGYTPSPTVSPTMCNGVVKITTLTHMYVVPILVSLMFLLR